MGRRAEKTSAYIGLSPKAKSAAFYHFPAAAACGDCYNPRMKAISHFRSPDAENPLAKHLREVADRARDFGAVFGASDWAECAGLLHDIGKFGEAFQKYIRESVQKERENAHIESEAPRAKNGARAG